MVCYVELQFYRRFSESDLKELLYFNGQMLGNQETRCHFQQRPALSQQHIANHLQRMAGEQFPESSFSLLSIASEEISLLLVHSHPGARWRWLSCLSWKRDLRKNLSITQTTSPISFVFLFSHPPQKLIVFTWCPIFTVQTTEVADKGCNAGLLHRVKHGYTTFVLTTSEQPGTETLRTKQNLQFPTIAALMTHQCQTQPM